VSFREKYLFDVQESLSFGIDDSLLREEMFVIQEGRQFFRGMYLTSENIFGSWTSCQSVYFGQSLNPPTYLSDFKQMRIHIFWMVLFLASNSIAVS
jgi:hypothetical protein